MKHDNRCPECGNELGKGHAPYRGLVCETCAADQRDRETERQIDENPDEVQS